MLIYKKILHRKDFVQSHFEKRLKNVNYKEPFG